MTTGNNGTVSVQSGAVSAAPPPPIAPPQQHRPQVEIGGRAVSVSQASTHLDANPQPNQAAQPSALDLSQWVPPPPPPESPVLDAFGIIFAQPAQPDAEEDAGAIGDRGRADHGSESVHEEKPDAGSFSAGPSLPDSASDTNDEQDLADEQMPPRRVVVADVDDPPPSDASSVVQGDDQAGSGDAASVQEEDHEAVRRLFADDPEDERLAYAPSVDLAYAPSVEDVEVERSQLDRPEPEIFQGSRPDDRVSDAERFDPTKIRLATPGTSMKVSWVKYALKGALAGSLLGPVGTVFGFLVGRKLGKEKAQKLDQIDTSMQLGLRHLESQGVTFTEENVARLQKLRPKDWLKLMTISSSKVPDVKDRVAMRSALIMHVAEGMPDPSLPPQQGIPGRKELMEDASLEKSRHMLDRDPLNDWAFQNAVMQNKHRGDAHRLARVRGLASQALHDLREIGFSPSEAQRRRLEKLTLPELSFLLDVKEEEVPNANDRDRIRAELLLSVASSTASDAAESSVAAIQQAMEVRADLIEMADRGKLHAVCDLNAMLNKRLGGNSGNMGAFLERHAALFAAPEAWTNRAENLTKNHEMVFSALAGQLADRMRNPDYVLTEQDCEVLNRALNPQAMPDDAVEHSHAFVPGKSVAEHDAIAAQAEADMQQAVDWQAPRGVYDDAAQRRDASPSKERMLDALSHIYLDVYSGKSNVSNDVKVDYQERYAAAQSFDEKAALFQAATDPAALTRNMQGQHQTQLHKLLVSLDASELPSEVTSPAPRPDNVTLKPATIHRGMPVTVRYDPRNRKDLADSLNQAWAKDYFNPASDLNPHSNGTTTCDIFIRDTKGAHMTLNGYPVTSCRDDYKELRVPEAEVESRWIGALENLAANKLDQGFTPTIRPDDWPRINSVMNQAMTAPLVNTDAVPSAPLPFGPAGSTDKTLTFDLNTNTNVPGVYRITATETMKTSTFMSKDEETGLMEPTIVPPNTEFSRTITLTLDARQPVSSMISVDDVTFQYFIPEDAPADVE
ncbi:MAG: hypothetical protein AAF899_00550 [Pseudomonadota bacterium]